MAINKTTYSMVGGTNKCLMPNIQGSAISINAFTENNTDGESNKDVRTYLQSAPGIKFLTTLGDKYKIDGIFVPSVGKVNNPDCYIAYQGRIYKMNEQYVIQDIGGYALGNTVQFAESGGERPIVLWVDTASIQGWDIKNEVLVDIELPKRITADEFISPSHIAVVSGSIVLNDTGTGYVYYSNPYPLSQDTREVFDIDENHQVQYEEDGITVKYKTVNSGLYCFYDDYSTQQYFNAESSSDKIKAVYSVGSLLTLYGTSSIEFWQRGDTESYQTWQRTSYTINKEQGLESAYSLCSVNNVQYFIGTGKANSKCVMICNNTSVEKISPLWLDEVLNDNNVDDIIGWTYSLNGHSFYLFNISDKCYVYDIKTGEWHIRTSRNFYGIQKAYLPLYCVYFNNKLITGCLENGNIYELDDKYFYEDFNATDKLPLLRIRQTPVIVNDYSPFIFNDMNLEVNTGHVANYADNMKMSLEISNDGGYTFGNLIVANGGKRGQYGARFRWLNLGMNRLCVIRVSYSQPTDLVISSANLRTTPTTML